MRFFEARYVRFAVAQPDRLGLAEPGNRDDVDVVVLVFVYRRHLLAGPEVGDQYRNRIAVGNDQDDLALVVLEDRLEYFLGVRRIVGIDGQVQFVRNRLRGLLGASERRRVDRVDAGNDIGVPELPR